jgi:4,5-DOPA dioxygenase extradiol
MIARQNGGQTPDYVRDFPDWMAKRLQDGDLDALMHYRELAPGAQNAHPTDEHLLPLYVALGAAGKDASVHRFHAGISDYVLAMDAYSFSPALSPKH